MSAISVSSRPEPNPNTNRESSEAPPRFTTSVLHQFYINWLPGHYRYRGATNGPSVALIPGSVSDLTRSEGSAGVDGLVPVSVHVKLLIALLVARDLCPSSRDCLRLDLGPSARHHHPVEEVTDELIDHRHQVAARDSASLA